MKSIVIMAWLVSPALVACSKEQEATPPPQSPPPTLTASATPAPAPPSSSPTPPKRTLKKEGEGCGGIAGFQCEEGLTCVMSEPRYPDQMGKCQKRP